MRLVNPDVITYFGTRLQCPRGFLSLLDGFKQEAVKVAELQGRVVYLNRDEQFQRAVRTNDLLRRKESTRIS